MVLLSKSYDFNRKSTFCLVIPSFFNENHSFTKQILCFLLKTIVLLRKSIDFFKNVWFYLVKLMFSIENEQNHCTVPKKQKKQKPKKHCTVPKKQKNNKKKPINHCTVPKKQIFNGFRDLGQVGQ